jgi:hypothetical protein
MTASIPDLEAYISFRLNGLGERNQHHEFEQIAIRVARKRISANILVANGPVSAGGDQQRDGETYTTRIPAEMPGGAGFSAAVSESPVVIACTVQQTSLKQKILSDLAGICSETAAPVGHVAFFSVSSIPEAVSHEVAKIARELYGVTLDVFSGSKLSTLLAEPDLVWVARHYLQVPAAMVPAPDVDESPHWYKERLEGFRRGFVPAAATPASQGEITEAIRFATYDQHARVDLPEWFGYMRIFLDGAIDSELSFRAGYEIAVAQFRGIGKIGESEELIKQAYDYALVSTQVHVLDDATTLIAYWGNMWISGMASATAEQIASARDAMSKHIGGLLDATDSITHPVRAASLTGSLAHLDMQYRWEIASKKGLTPSVREIAHSAGVSLVDKDISLDPEVIDGEVVCNVSGTMQHLSALIELVPRARAYSVTSLSELFDFYAPVLIQESRYVSVRDFFDATVAATEGDAAVGQRCYERAMSLAKAGHLRSALADLHEAKIRWFRGDSLYGSILVARHIAVIYSMLGMGYAAKTYGFGSAMMANQSADIRDKAQLPKALFEVASFAHTYGCWVDAAALTKVGRITQSLYAKDPFDLAEHPLLDERRTNDGIALAAIQKFWPELERIYAEAHGSGTWYDSLVELANHPQGKMPFTEPEYARLATGQFKGDVLGDLGPQRFAHFSAYGIDWLFDYANNEASVLASEEFIGAFQILLVEAGVLEPVLFVGSVTVHLRASDGGEDAGRCLEVEDSGEAFVVHITLPGRFDDLDAHIKWLASVGVELLSVLSATSHSRLLALIDPLVRDGLAHKLILGRPYRETANLMPTGHYDLCASSNPPALSHVYIPTDHAELSAATSDGPSYEREEALRRIGERYEASHAWSSSVQRFLGNSSGRRLYEELRAEGWLDWQFLSTFVNVGLNYQVHTRQLDPRSLNGDALLRIISEGDANGEVRVPADYVLDTWAVTAFTQTASVAVRWGIVLPSPAVGLEGLRELLIRRYQYGVDDVPHAAL